MIDKKIISYTLEADRWPRYVVLAEGQGSFWSQKELGMTASRTMVGKGAKAEQGWAPVKRDPVPGFNARNVPMVSMSGLNMDQIDELAARGNPSAVEFLERISS